jgi:uncharacterized Fe-S cluster protein YjdI
MPKDMENIRKVISRFRIMVARPVSGTLKSENCNDIPLGTEMNNNNNREYTNGEITVFWKPSTCIHATICFMKLRKVFDPTKRPWVNMQGATTQEIIDICDQCPTDALTWKWNRDLSATEQEDLSKEPVGEEQVPVPVTEINIIENGPALIKGKFRVTKAGKPITTGEMISICRCGHSHNQPFCDGTHYDTKFRG